MKKMVNGESVELTAEEIAAVTAMGDSFTASDAVQAAKEAQESIKRQLAENDIKCIRALIEGDTARVAEWKAKQAALRERLVK